MFSIWAALDSKKRLIVLLATIATLLAVVGMVRVATTPGMALLYSGLDPATAGDVVASLEQKGILFEVRGNTIFVDSGERDQARLTLAAEGLPANGASGYEILDGLSGFGTTSQMFDAAYWRAKEGELARTIVASPGIRAARVHIASPVRQPFARDISSSASVTVTMARGQLAEKQAIAIRYLVSSAVSGLQSDNVSIIDAVAGVVLASGNAAASFAANDGPDARARELKANIERLLSARVGPGKAVVEVMIDADMESQTTSERLIDPASRVVVSSETEETTGSASGSDSGAVTVASNLPDGEAGGAGAESRSTDNQSRERLSFEVSETMRETVRLPGHVRRITVAVLVDGITTLAADGQRSWSPRPDEEISALRSLVESAMGYDANRGDAVTIASLEFPQDPLGGTLAIADDGFFASSIMTLIQTLILGVVALLLGMFVVRPILTQTSSLPAPDVFEGQSSEIFETDFPIFSPGQMMGGDTGSDEQSKISNLRNVVTSRADDSAEVLKRWIDAPEPKEELV